MNITAEQAEAEILALIRSWPGYEMHSTREIDCALERLQRRLSAEYDAKFSYEERKAHVGITMSDDEIVAWFLQHRPEEEPLTDDERREWLEHVVGCGGVEHTALGDKGPPPWLFVPFRDTSPDDDASLAF